MKTLMMFGSATALLLSAFAVELTSSNVLGIQQVKQNKNDVVVPVTFAGVGTGGATTLAETLYLDNLSMADTVSVMLNDADEYYTSWIWLPGFMTDLYWTARHDGTTEVKPSAQSLSRGVGLKVSVASVATRVYTLGEYTSDPISITFSGRTSTYVANPSATESLDLDLIFSGEKYSFSANDSITVTDGNRELSYYFIANGEGKFWGRPKISYYVENGVLKTDVSAYEWDLPKIKPGEGFRFQRMGRSALTVTW